MWPWKSQPDYHAVAVDDEDSESGHNKREQPKRRPWIACSLVLVLAVVVLASFSYDLRTRKASTGEVADAESPTHDERCQPRREWRSLSPAEQQEYISAVLCLKSQPSTLAPGTNHTAYEDFPWIHSHVGYATHHSAPFLPWHRYFLHIYESTLRDKCSYHGGLVYWDWTLDWEGLEKSPLFDPETGFGGDGEEGGEVVVGRTGRCLQSGPFANTTVEYYDVKYHPHCLSRGFRDLDGTLGHMNGDEISPAAIESVLSADSYESFVEQMEANVHDVIPFGISGDFETFTAPYDPLFFLHHTQLDRLWWLWQQRQPNRGLDVYSGHKSKHSIEMASLDDDLLYRNLAEGVKVREVMDVEGGVLCYRYS